LLSLFRETSEIGHVNARAHREPVRVSPEVFRLLAQAQTLWRETDGAFDIAVGSLTRCWRGCVERGAAPPGDALEAARRCSGFQFVTLDADNLTVRFAREGVSLDLGAIGKGYAVDGAVRVLRDAGVTSALLHSGTSTVAAIGRPPGAPAWPVAIPSPTDHHRAEAEPLAVIPLRDACLSVSAVWGKALAAETPRYGHVLDPRTGWPVAGSLLAAVRWPQATETDALSTALLVAGLAGYERIANLRPGMGSLVVAQGKGADPFQVKAWGLPVASGAYSATGALTVNLRVTAPPEVVGESSPDNPGARTYSPQPLDSAAGHGTSEPGGRGQPPRVENPRSEPTTSGGARRAQSEIDVEIGVSTD
jgi:thiamine biosynthesis lipoprotein